MMHRSERLLKMVRSWVDKIGEKEAKKRLVIRGVGLSTADHIVHNRYYSTPKLMLASILEEEMKKDGLELKSAG